MRTKLVNTLKKTVDEQLCSLGVCPEPEVIFVDVTMTKDQMWMEINKKFDEIDASKNRK